ncbi:MAG TPA: flagellar hook-basal body complex protein FliE [Sediminispirochaeta sp.]|nr:flagellar hook-basal body complex protein FliE [Sediminispirochaeta sp.]
MNDILSSGVSGHIVRLEQSNPRHLGGRLHPESENNTGSLDFSSVLTGKLQEVSQLDQESMRLSRQFITDPDSVDAHDVTIAMSKANLAVSLTKAVVDEALRAYRDIINLR